MGIALFPFGIHSDGAGIAGCWRPVWVANSRGVFKSVGCIEGAPACRIEIDLRHRKAQPGPRP